MNRRDALRRGLAMMAAPALPDDALFNRDQEAYWNRVRDEQFFLPGWRAFLNNGTLGIIPRPVMQAMTDFLNRAAALQLEEYPRWGYETLDEARAELAAFSGCRKEELAIVHNATEAMCTVAGGIGLKPGEEVLITNQEHPSGRGCWYQRAARSGIKVRVVDLPLPPESHQQLAGLVASAIGPTTRVLSFSGITSATGLLMPIRQICDAARERGVTTVVDGAHMHGQVPFRLSELGCDYFAGSPHKWLFAPAGSGLLYGREDMLDRLWVNTCTTAWEDKTLKAARFMMLGTNNRSVVEGLVAGLRFLKALGPERVYGRIHQLAQSADHRLRQMPGIEMLSSADHRLYGGMVAFRMKADVAAALAELCKKKRIWTLASERTRLSTHIHTRPRDLDLFCETLAEAART